MERISVAGKAEEECLVWIGFGFEYCIWFSGWYFSWRWVLILALIPKPTHTLKNQTTLINPNHLPTPNHLNLKPHKHMFALINYINNFSLTLIFKTKIELILQHREGMFSVPDYICIEDRHIWAINEVG